MNNGCDYHYPNCTKPTKGEEISIDIFCTKLTIIKIASKIRLQTVKESINRK